MRRVLHVIETIAPWEGGPPRVVAGLAVAQRSMGSEAQVLCGDGCSLAEHLHYWEAHVAGFRGEHVHSIAARGGTLLARAAAAQVWLHTHLSSYDVVHIHQLWRLVPTLAARACGRLGMPYLIAPHTSMSPWALSQKRVKKMLARRLIWDRNFAGAAGFHALNDLEAAEIREFLGPGGPTVFVVPNGVALAELATSGAGSAPTLAGGLSAPEGRRPFILFLARLHTMKGPDLLLEGFAGIAAERNDLQLVFAGPDYGMRAVLQRRAAQLQLLERIHFLGLVSGVDRLWLLNNAVCLCQPSRDEGFSLSILEAMACGRAVVISDRCKFPQVAEQGAGVIVPLSTPELAAALRRYVGDAARRAGDGQSARRLIEQRYTWDNIALQAERMYAQATGREGNAAAPWPPSPISRS